MDFNKMTKAEIAQEFLKLESEKASLTHQVQNAVTVANFYGQNLEIIEKFVQTSPFLNNQGKFLKTVWWVLTNFNKVREFIEAIAKQIKYWRASVDDMIRQAQEAKDEASVSK